MPAVQPINTPVVNPPSVGPFKAIGMLFGSIGVAVNTLNEGLYGVQDVVVNTRKQLNNGFKAVDIVVNGALADFANDELVNDAEREIKRVEAEAKAEAIIASLNA